MITIRDLSRSDRAIGAITTDECHLIAAVLNSAAQHWAVRLFLPKPLRKETLKFRMLAATLGRTPEERAPSLQTQIKLSMDAGKTSGR